MPESKPTPAPGPCLLVPGLCGSVLHVRGVGEEGEGRREWIVAERADAAFRALWGRYCPDSREIQSLTQEEVIIPTGGLNDGGLYACDLLDPSLNILPPAALRYFHTLIQTMTREWGHVPGHTLHGFPYDFRQSNLRHLEALLAKLERISGANGGVKVDVISHSMGGLVVKLLLAKYPTQCARLVRSWVAIAAPFNGAPGFTADALLTGVQFVSGWANYFFVQRETLRQMVCQAPSIFELLPSGDMDWGHEAGTPRVTIRLTGPVDELSDEDTIPVVAPQAAAAATVVAGEGEKEGSEGDEEEAPVEGSRYTFNIADDGLRELMRLCMRDNEVTLQEKGIPLPLVDEILDHAMEMRSLLAKAELPPDCKMLNLFGTGLPTPFSCAYGTEAAPLQSLASLSDGSTTAVFETLDGDGTVPAVSARRDGLAAFQRVGLTGDHRQLMELPASLDLIHGFLSEVANDEAVSVGDEGDELEGHGERRHLSHFYTGMRYWPYCTEPDELPEVEGGWLMV